MARAIDAVLEGFGKPHFHSGLGIRRLRKDYFECRSGIGIRLVFRAGKGCLTFLAAGDDDAIRRLLRSLDQLSPLPTLLSSFRLHPAMSPPLGSPARTAGRKTIPPPQLGTRQTTAFDRRTAESARITHRK